MHLTNFPFHCFCPAPCHLPFSLGSCMKFLSGFSASTVSHPLEAIRTISLKCKLDSAASFLKTSHRAPNKIQIPSLACKAVCDRPPAYLSDFTSYLTGLHDHTPTTLALFCFSNSDAGLPNVWPGMSVLGPLLGSLFPVIQVSAKPHLLSQPSLASIQCSLCLLLTSYDFILLHLLF